MSQNIFLESMFWLFNFALLTVSTKVVEKWLTLKQATIVGSILWILSICMYLIPAGPYYYSMLILAELIRAVGLALKSVADFPLVTQTLEKNGLIDESYYKQVEGNCLAVNCAGDAIMALLSTGLMAINKDLPMWICLISCFYGLVLSCRLPEQGKLAIKKVHPQKISYKNLLNNKVICTIIVHVTVTYGTFCYWESLGKDLIQELDVQNMVYSIIVAVCMLGNSLGGFIAGKNIFVKLFKNMKNPVKSFISIITNFNISLFAVLGVMGLIGTDIAVFVIAVVLVIQSLLKSSYIVTMKALLQKNSMSEMAKLRIGNLLMSGEHLGKTIILTVASGIVKISSTAICYIVLAAILIVPCAILSKNLRVPHDLVD